MMRMDVPVTVSGLLVFLLSLVVSAIAAWLLLRAFRQSRQRLLFWSFLCFALLAVNCSETLLDYVLPPWVDLRIPRAVTILAAVSALLYGFIWEAE